MSARPRVVVLGGGFGGMEAAFYLRYKLGDGVDLTLVSDHSYFIFRPNSIYVPFGVDPRCFEMPLARVAKRKKITLIVSRVLGVQPQARKVFLLDRELDYDYLVIATGADSRPGEIPGLGEHAIVLWAPEQMLRFRAELGKLVQAARDGARRRLLFLIPPNDLCSGPLYEIALMTDTWLRRQQVRAAIDIVWTTSEAGYLQAFGPRLNSVVVQEFEERGINGSKSLVVTHVEPGVVHYQGGDQIEFDLLAAFPPYIAKQNYDSLPCDNRGFVRVDPDSRRVKDEAEIFAVGDAADFPIKQAFLALMQGDAAAEHIAAAITGKPPVLEYEPMSMCVMEEINRATFAQVPLKYANDPLRPMAATEDNEHYKVGIAPLWRIGKKMPAVYAPWRFGHGEPFHTGFRWEAMDFGLKVMSKVLTN